MTDEIKEPSEAIDKKKLVDEDKRQFLMATSGLLGMVGAVCALSPFVSSWLPGSKAQANGAPVTVDLSQMQPGEQLTVPWRGKPVWVIRRTKKMIRNLAEDQSDLRDPLSLVNQQPAYAKNNYRSIDPEYLVVIGICTHLGCVPNYKPQAGELTSQWPGGFFCPCHGSTFDLAGRVFKAVPAPVNLEVPPYHFSDTYTLVIGEHG